MKKRFSFILTWFLLLAFSVPSIGGTGLHLVLNHFAPGERGTCCAHHFVKGGHHYASAGQDKDSNTDSNWESTAEGHDANHCFLCHFLTQSPETAPEWGGVTGCSFLEEIILFAQNLHSHPAQSHFGRGPPDILS